MGEHREQRLQDYAAARDFHMRLAAQVRATVEDAQGNGLGGFAVTAALDTARRHEAEAQRFQAYIEEQAK